MRIDETLAVKATALKRKCPEDWQAFLDALDQRFSEAQIELMTAPQADLPIAQGKARALAALISALKNAHVVVDKIEKRV